MMKLPLGMLYNETHRQILDTIVCNLNEGLSAAFLPTVTATLNTLCY